MTERSASISIVLNRHLANGDAHSSLLTINIMKIMCSNNAYIYMLHMKSSNYKITAACNMVK